MRAIAEDTDLDLAARSSVNVMVTASNGGDRAAWARAIHDRSGRRAGPFVTIYAHTVPAISGTVRPQDLDDCFDRAAGGTLFIDHVGHLSPHAQARLLSLVTDPLRQANGTPTRRANQRVRVVVGSDRSLDPDLAAGTFSDVLFYRLNVIRIDQIHPHESGETP
jgi:two-component system response regulator HydG